MMRLGPFQSALLCVVAAGSLAGQPAKLHSRALDKGLARYRQNEIEEAIPYFREHVQRHPRDPDGLAWLAEALRRAGEVEEAIRSARQALALDVCHSAAHTTLANACNPQLPGTIEATYDTTWVHLLAAVRCDSTDGDAWFGVWTESLRRGREDLEEKALRTLVETGFLTPTLLAYNRWVLRSLPDRAMLLTNGDMDTYPALGLQIVEGLRRDVAVVNFSMLNLESYRDLVQHRYGLPDVYLDPEVKRQPRDQAVAGWMDQLHDGSFPRPLAISATVEMSTFGPELRDRFQLAGPFFNCLPTNATSRVDTADTRRSLNLVAVKDFSGPWVAPGDRSPVRIMGTPRLAQNVVFTALSYGYALLATGRTAEVREVVRWARTFAARTTVGSTFDAAMDRLEEEARTDRE